MAPIRNVKAAHSLLYNCHVFTQVPHFIRGALFRPSLNGRFRGKIDIGQKEFIPTFGGTLWP